MATLIAVFSGGKCLGRCDARCYDGQSAACACICGGKNHGVGLEAAKDNTRADGEAWIDQFCQGLDQAKITSHISNQALQVPLFDIRDFQSVINAHG